MLLIAGLGCLIDFCAATASRYYAAIVLGIWCTSWEADCADLNKLNHFSVLSAEEHGSDEFPELPHYDIS